MKVLNLIWGFTLGAGIDKCFLTYARLGDVDESVDVKSLCINVLSRNSHIEPLKELGVDFIDINSPKDFRWIGKLAEYIRQYKPDVLFTHGFNGAIIALIVRIVKGIKVKTILTYHGSYHAPTKAKKLLEPIYNGLTHWIYKNFANITISVAEYSRQFLISKGVPALKVVTVHNGIKDIPTPKPFEMRHDVVNIITASRIDKVKGLSYMMEAVEKLKQRGLKFHYYMIGEGPELNEMKRIRKEKKLEDMVSFEGFQSNVPEWLAAADIFALPSLYEYHSIAVLEAMRASKAIVATTVGGNGESITDMEQGLMVPAADSKAFADALERIIRDADLRKRLSENARKRFEEEFTEDAMKRNLVRVIKGF